MGRHGYLGVKSWGRTQWVDPRAVLQAESMWQWQTRGETQ